MDLTDFFNGLARVYEAGAKECRSTPFNVQRSLQAETYEAMAAAARAEAQGVRLPKEDYPDAEGLAVLRD